MKKALFFTVFFASQLFANTWEVASIPPRLAEASVRITTGRSGGSGTVVYSGEKYALVLTCRHLFSGTAQPWSQADGRLQVHWISGRVAGAQVVAISPSRGPDLAVIAVRGDPAIVAIPVSRRTPREGDRLYQAGWPSGRFVERHGAWRGYTGLVGSWRSASVGLRSDRGYGSLPGDSGSGVFSAEQELVAVVWGGSDGWSLSPRGTAEVVGLEDCRAFLDQHCLPFT